MYDELVKSLRVCGRMTSIDDNCISYVNGCCEAFPDCAYALMDQAADAIEELSHDYEKLAEDFNGAVELLHKREKPRWIPVTERLPEEPYGCLLVVWDSPQNGGDDFLNYLPYFAGWDGEQWNDADGEQVPFEVVYWRPLQPLPQPPKEE